MYILGISAFYHDSAACITKDGEIVAAAQEKRFTRKKHDASFPCHAIKYCMQEAQIDAEQIDNVVFYEKPFIKDDLEKSPYLDFCHVNHIVNKIIAENIWNNINNEIKFKN